MEARKAFVMKGANSLVRKCKYGIVGGQWKVQHKKPEPATLFPQSVFVWMVQRKQRTVPEVPRLWRCFHVLFVAALFIRKPPDALFIAQDLSTDNISTFAYRTKSLDDITQPWLNPISSTIRV